MLLKTVTFNEKYREQCWALMQGTWNFDRFFPKANPTLIYQLFFREATSSANYSQLIVDENDRLHGYIFGTARPNVRQLLKKLWSSIYSVLWVFGQLIRGKFGPIGIALKRSSKLVELTNQLESLRRSNDAYVNLFIVDTSLRGRGWGKQLLESYAQYAKTVGCPRLYLWTDKGCNFQFYDHTGFLRVKQIKSPFLTDPGDEPNGFVYTRPIEFAR